MKTTYNLTQIERFAAEVGASFYRSRAGVLSYVMPDGATMVSFREVAPGTFIQS